MQWLRRLFKRNGSDLCEQFEAALGENLYSLIQYGSSVRNTSGRKNYTDINLLIVLNRSTPEAHAAIHGLVSNNPEIEPFILEKRGFDRTLLSFAVKFLSISRNYRLLSGHDVLSGLNISLSHERFLAEQALRNLRLKVVHCYAKRGPSRIYLKFVLSLSTSFIVDISEVLRCETIDVPVKYSDRIEAFSKKFDFDVSILKDLLALKNKSISLDVSEIEILHRNLFILLDNVLLYVESQWNV